MNLSHSSEAFFKCKTTDMLKFNVQGKLTTGYAFGFLNLHLFINKIVLYETKVTFYPFTFADPPFSAEFL